MWWIFVAKWLFILIVSAVVLRQFRHVKGLTLRARFRKLRRDLSWLALIYLIMILALMAAESSIVFVPTKAADTWNAPLVVHNCQDVWLPSPAGDQVHCWWCPIKQPRWVVLYCHGNDGNLSFRQYILASWQVMGASIMVFDYPGYGRSTGEATETGCYAAAQAAYDWLVGKMHVPPQRLVLFGKSLGSAMAVNLALTQPSLALVLHSPFTSIPDVGQYLFPLFPVRLITRTQFDNLSKLPDYHGPLFIAHGTADMLVPYEQSERLLEAAGSSVKQLSPLPGYDHHNSVVLQFFEDASGFLYHIDHNSTVDPQHRLPVLRVTPKQ